MKIRKAEAHEIRNYAAKEPKPLYRLFGYVTGVPAELMGQKTTMTVPVEYLGEGRGEPNYEAILPKGLHLSGENIHTVLGATQAGLLERLAAGLEECVESCG